MLNSILDAREQGLTMAYVEAVRHAEANRKQPHPGTALAQRLARMEGALKWCQNDIRYKAPEQLTPAYFGSLLDKATQALEVE